MNRENMKTKFSRLICLLTALVFMISTVIVPVYAAEETNANEQEYIEEEIAEPDDTESRVYEESADSWRFQDGFNISDESSPFLRSRAAFTAWSKTDEGFINSNGDVIEGAVRKGIDVSSWQGTINWDKVKASGIDFAIIRCGYGSDLKNQDDSQFIRNVAECERVGIPYGVYLYSYANTEAKAKSEAQHALRLLKEADADPDYPVYYDLEDKIVSDAGKSKIKKYAQIFCSTLEAADYEAGIYANLDWWTNKLNEITSDASFDIYDKWVAQYYSECQYSAGEYRLWQCTSSGTVSGISGNVDLNFEFELKNETNNITGSWIQDENGKTVFRNSDGTIASSQWVTYRGCTYYVDSKSEKVTGIKTISGKKYYFNSAGELQKSKWISLSGKKYYALSDGSFAVGYKKISNYYYLFDSAGVMKTGTVTMKNKQYKLYSSGKACIHTAKTTTAVNYRTGPSTHYKKKGTYKKNKLVYVIRTSSGWSKLSNGYWIKSSNLKKVTTYPKTISKFKSYKVKTTTAVNYRTGPSTSYKKKGTYKKGKTLTIVAAKNGWGKISSGYWLKRSYTKKVKK